MTPPENEIEHVTAHAVRARGSTPFIVTSAAISRVRCNFVSDKNRWDEMLRCAQNDSPAHVILSAAKHLNPNTFER
jgi:hypothetical protein